MDATEDAAWRRLAAAGEGRALPDGTLNALGRHLALVGFMGAGKSTLGPELAERLGRPFVSVDAVVEERTGSTVAELFAERGQEAFRELEERVAIEVLTRRASRGRRARRRGARRRADADRTRRARVHGSPRDDAGGGVEARLTRRSSARARLRRVLGALRGTHTALRGGGRRARARQRRRAPGGGRHPHLGGGCRRSRRARSRRRASSSSSSTPGSSRFTASARAEHSARGSRRVTSSPRVSGRRRSAQAERLWSSLRLDREGTVDGARRRLDMRPCGLRRGARTSAGSRGFRCRRRSSPRSTPPSAGRRPSTSSEARTSLARFTGPRGSSSTRSSWQPFPPRSSGTVSPR